MRTQEIEKLKSNAMLAAEAVQRLEPIFAATVRPLPVALIKSEKKKKKIVSKVVGFLSPSCVVIIKPLYYIFKEGAGESDKLEKEGGIAGKWLLTCFVIYFPSKQCFESIFY